MVPLTGVAAELVGALKQLVDRARPGAQLRFDAPDATPSFPSGHTSMTAASAGLLVWLAWPHLGRAARAGTVAGALLVSLTVGASRIYLGYHGTTDVVAAWLVVTAWLGTRLLAVSRRLRPPTPAPVPVPRSGHEQVERGTVVP